MFNSRLREPRNLFSDDAEFSLETSVNMPPYSSYINNGIKVDNSHDHVKIEYSGLLANCGADTIFAVVGYGNNEHWDNVQYYPMKRTGDRKFEVTIPSKFNGIMNIAFKDSANNWDNNSGMNYTFTNFLQ